MKKKFFMLWALLAGVLCASAANSVTVADATIPQGGSGSIDIVLDNDDVFTAFSFKLTLPEGIGFVLDEEDGTPTFEPGSRFSDHSLTSSTSGKVGIFACLSLKNSAITGTGGTLLSVNVTADAGLAVGTKLTATLSELTFTTPSEQEVNLADVTVNITVGEPIDPRTILDEASTTAPVASKGNVDILVKRTINANEWSTIVLPFDMTEEQVKSIFGSDVKLAEFDSYEVSDDETSISVDFVEADLSEGFLANYPYLIKTSKDIAEFEVNAAIDPDEENAVAEYAEGRGSKRHVYGTFIGTYHAGDYIPANNLFLSSNKFYYSVGKTKIKAFRAYLGFEDVLASVGGEAPVRFTVNDEVTRITDIENAQVLGGVYTLQGVSLGQKDVQSLPKGIYIVDGKKVSVK